LVPEARPVVGRSPWSILHITISILGLAMLALAFIAAALYLLQFRELKAKRFGQVFRLFPPLERLDQLNHLSLVVGFPTVTLGVLLGFGLRYAGGVSVDAAQVGGGMVMWLVRRCAAAGVQPHRVLPGRARRRRSRSSMGAPLGAPGCRAQCERVWLRPARSRRRATPVSRIGRARFDDPRRAADSGAGARRVGRLEAPGGTGAAPPVPIGAAG